MEILVFELDDQRYGLAVDDVREVVRVVRISPLPKAPAIVEGVINVRGTVTAVMNIRKRFGKKEKTVQLTDHLVLARVSSSPRLVRRPGW